MSDWIGPIGGEIPLNQRPVTAQQPAEGQERPHPAVGDWTLHPLDDGKNWDLYGPNNQRIAWLTRHNAEKLQPILNALEQQVRQLTERNDQLLADGLQWITIGNENDELRGQVRQLEDQLEALDDAVCANAIAREAALEQVKELKALVGDLTAHLKYHVRWEHRQQFTHVRPTDRERTADGLILKADSLSKGEK